MSKLKLIKMKLTEHEKNNYVMKDKKDFAILSKIKKLEKGKLSKNDNEIVKLIKTQLKKNWRTPLIRHLDKMLKKY